MEQELIIRRKKALIKELVELHSETPWVEFKHNNKDAVKIGKYLSALSNAAALFDKPAGYVIWGIEDATHNVIGTNFEPSTEKVNNQPLELWLAKRLSPSIDFRFEEIIYLDKRLIMLEVPAATSMPVEFEQIAYVRIGEATPKLSDYPERLRNLWSKLQSFVWEAAAAAQFQTGDQVLDKLNYTSYFELTTQRLPDNREGIFERLVADQIISPDVGGHWNITNLGAILFAKQLSSFSPAIERKAIRFIAHEGASRADTAFHRTDGTKGYAVGFAGLVEYINDVLPRNEEIVKAHRVEQPLYPSIAIRELIANALIHQDMTISGAGPMIELFSDRMEITNPGKPLVNPDRFLDLPPRSRNEALASLMRRMKFCEEQGTGIDKVLAHVEIHQLPPPDFRLEGESVKVILYAPRSFAQMTPNERVRACYQHAALKYISGDRMKNSTLCERFGIETSNASQASKVIKQALDENLIKPADPKHPRTGYVPIWA